MTQLLAGKSPKTLGDIAHFVRGITFKPEDVVAHGTPGSVTCFRTKNVQADLDVDDLMAVPENFVRRDEQVVRAGDILVSTANSWNLVGKCCWVPELAYKATLGGFISLIRANPSVCDSRYLYYWCTSAPTQELFRKCGRQTTNISNLNIGLAERLPVPLPYPSEPAKSLSEQRRIAAILDKADSIRRKRRDSADLAGNLRWSLFMDFFGDPHTNRKGFPVARFEKLWSDELRNGISPSHAGAHRGRVLILSAITGHRFDSTEIKESTFADPFDAGDLVNTEDFLICRGNGNRGLVGIGQFPDRSFSDVVFPDTMIAARINKSVIASAFLSTVWRSDHVRRQIETLARTTNGTYKINQTMLESIQFPLPPMDLQNEFTNAAERSERMRERLDGDAANQLFRSLVQRAFRGEL